MHYRKNRWSRAGIANPFKSYAAIQSFICRSSVLSFWREGLPTDGSHRLSHRASCAGNVPCLAYATMASNTKRYL
jgi:hypothetical protein